MAGTTWGTVTAGPGAGKIVHPASPAQVPGCTQANGCGCGPPAFCNKWILFFLQVCEGSQGQDGTVDTSVDGSQTYTMPRHIFVDMSSIPTEVANPPPQSVTWQPTFGTSRSFSIPGLTTGSSFVLGDSSFCAHETDVDPYSSGCDHRAVLSPAVSGVADCTTIDLNIGAGNFACDPKAVHNVPAAPSTLTTVPLTAVSPASDGVHLNAITTLFVNDTTGFPTSGSVQVGVVFGGYTGITGTSLTGFSCGSSIVAHTGMGVSPLFFTNGPTVEVTSTHGYASSGTIFVDAIGVGWVAIPYTGTTPTSFTGCTGTVQTVISPNWTVYGTGTGSIDPTCPNPAPSGGIAVSFYYVYKRISGSDCALSEARLVNLYSPY